MHGSRLFSIMGGERSVSMGCLAILPGAHSRMVLVRLDNVVCCSGELNKYNHLSIT